METKTYVAINPEFQITDYIIAPENMGRMTLRTRKPPEGMTDPYPMYQLWNGNRWFVAPEEVFKLWLNAYESGLADGNPNVFDGDPGE